VYGVQDVYSTPSGVFAVDVFDEDPELLDDKDPDFKISLTCVLNAFHSALFSVAI
jgi:hypothetical protein